MILRVDVGVYRFRLSGTCDTIDAEVKTTKSSVSQDMVRVVYQFSYIGMCDKLALRELADGKKNGYIDQTGFVVAMYLIRALVTRKITTVPSSLPRAIYEAASQLEVIFHEPISI